MWKRARVRTASGGTTSVVVVVEVEVVVSSPPTVLVDGCTKFLVEAEGELVAEEEEVEVVATPTPTSTPLTMARMMAEKWAGSRSRRR